MKKIIPRSQQTPTNKQKKETKLSELPPLNNTSSNITYNNKIDNSKVNLKTENKTFSIQKNETSQFHMFNEKNGDILIQKNERLQMPKSYSNINICQPNANSEVTCTTPHHQRYWSKNKLDYNELKFYDQKESHLFNKKKQVSVNYSTISETKAHHDFRDMQDIRREKDKMRNYINKGCGSKVVPDKFLTTMIKIVNQHVGDDSTKADEIDENNFFDDIRMNETVQAYQTYKSDIIEPEKCYNISDGGSYFDKSDMSRYSEVKPLTKSQLGKNITDIHKNLTTRNTKIKKTDGFNNGGDDGKKYKIQKNQKSFDNNIMLGKNIQPEESVGYKIPGTMFQKEINKSNLARYLEAKNQALWESAQNLHTKSQTNSVKKIANETIKSNQNASKKKWNFKANNYDPAIKSKVNKTIFKTFTNFGGARFPKNFIVNGKDRDDYYKKVLDDPQAFLKYRLQNTEDLYAGLTSSKKKEVNVGKDMRQGELFENRKKMDKTEGWVIKFDQPKDKAFVCYNKQGSKKKVFDKSKFRPWEDDVYKTDVPTIPSIQMTPIKSKHTTPKIKSKTMVSFFILNLRHQNHSHLVPNHHLIQVVVQ